MLITKQHCRPRAFAYPNEQGPAGVKALMELMGTVKNQVRLPNVPVSAAIYGAIEAEWKKIR